MTKLGNEALSRVGPGTPIGNLFRRFWLPALLAKEIEQPASTPVRLRILSEDLLAFRDSAGRVGIISAYCRHRLAPLYYGRNEDCGIRCVYHGWKFDVEGKCVDIPNIQPPDNFEDLKGRASIKSYPTHEAGGLIWVYMGPPEAKPAFPAIEFTTLPADQIHVSRWLHRTTWHLALEGEMDTSHISFLHQSESAVQSLKMASYDGAPQITLKETDYGYVYGARRDLEGGDYYWRITHLMLPMWSAIAGPLTGYMGNGRGWVPIDDGHTMAFSYYCADEPFTPAQVAAFDSGASFPPRTVRAAVELPNGTVIDTPDPVASKKNDYLIDRDMQRNGSFTGILGVNEQDRALIESMSWPDPERPGVADVSTELLVRADYSIMAARRLLLRLAEDLERGAIPRAVENPDQFGVRAAAIVSSIDNFDELMAAHPDLLCAPGPAKTTPADAPFS